MYGHLEESGLEKKGAYKTVKPIQEGIQGGARKYPIWFVYLQAPSTKGTMFSPFCIQSNIRGKYFVAAQ